MTRRGWMAALALLISASCTAGSQHGAPTSTTPPPRTPEAPSTIRSDPSAGTTSDAVPGPPVRTYQLASTPEGYVEAERLSAGDFSKVVYRLASHPAQHNSPEEGMRISVEVTRPLILLDDIDPAYPKEGEAQVRGDKRALYFLVGSAVDDPHARHGLAWDETSDLRIAVYAFTDLNGLTRLAEQVRPAA